MQEASIELKTVFTAKAPNNVEEEIQEFVIWFMENLTMFTDLYKDTTDSTSSFTIKLEE